MITTMPAGLVATAGHAMVTLGLRLHRGEPDAGHHAYKTDVGADREYLDSLAALDLDSARWLRALYATALALTSERIAELSPGDDIQIGRGHSDTVAGLEHMVVSGPGVEDVTIEAERG